jgi:predicted peroxiredoxin
LIWVRPGSLLIVAYPRIVAADFGGEEEIMARLLITATYGYDNSTRAAMPFYVAKGAKETGIDVGLVLALDATVLVRPEFRQHVQPYGQPPLEELFQFAVDHQIPVYV